MTTRRSSSNAYQYARAFMQIALTFALRIDRQRHFARAYLMIAHLRTDSAFIAFCSKTLNFIMIILCRAVIIPILSNVQGCAAILSNPQT